MALSTQAHSNFELCLGIPEFFKAFVHEINRTRIRDVMMSELKWRGQPHMRTRPNHKFISGPGNVCANAAGNYSAKEVESRSNGSAAGRWDRHQVFLLQGWGLGRRYNLEDQLPKWVIDAYNK